MSQIKNLEQVKEILDEMHKSVVGGLVTAQLSGSNSVAEVVNGITPSFKKYEKEDILSAFAVFALNVAISDVNREMGINAQAAEEDNSDGLPLASGGQA